MPEMFVGQEVRIKSLAEIEEEFGMDIEALRNEPIIGSLVFERRMMDYLGEVFQITDVDNRDSTIALEGTGLWWSMELVELASEPGTFFGFKVGDKVEFRQYEDMEEDGTLEESAFVDGMKYLCGTVGTITEIHPRDAQKANIVLIDEHGQKIPYILDTMMFERVTDVPAIADDDWATVAFI